MWHRSKWVWPGLLTLALAAGPALGQGQEQRRQQPGQPGAQERQQQERQQQERERDWQRGGQGEHQALQQAVQQMKAQNFSLDKAIKQAEQQTNGTAIGARVIADRSGRMGMDEQMERGQRPGEREREPQRPGQAQREPERERPGQAQRETERPGQQPTRGQTGEFTVHVYCLTPANDLQVVVFDAQGQVKETRTASAMDLRRGSWFEGERETGQEYARAAQRRAGGTEREMRQGAEREMRSGARAENLRLVRATKVMAADVKNNAGNDLGDVADLAIDPSDGRVMYAALTFGGFLGMGEKHFAVPLPALELRGAQGDDEVVLNVTEAELENDPGFTAEEGAWPKTANKRWSADAENRWRMAGAEARAEMQRPADWIKRAEHIIGAEVKNTRDEDLGEISDLYIDPDRSRVVYAILSHGGVLGIGEKLIAVPWEAFQNPGQEKVFRLDVSKERLETAPNFTANEWNRTSEPDYVVLVYQFYNISPDWQRQRGDRGEMEDEQHRDRERPARPGGGG